MSISRRSTLFLGIFIFIIPFLGFPSVWKAALTVLSGIFLVGLSVKISIPKKTMRKPVREKVMPVFVESIPVVSPRNDTIEMSTEEAPIEIKPEAKPEVKPKRTRSKKTNAQSF